MSNTNINAKLVIDPATRRITSNSEIFLAKNDCNSTTLTFEIPRYIDSHDMSGEDKVIHLHYANMDISDSQKVSKGFSEITDISADEDKVSFSWTVPGSATRHAGVLSVGVTVESYDGGDGSAEEVYSWSSAPYGNITVFDSMDNDNETADREQGVLINTCNAIVAAALRGDLSHLVTDALEEAKRTGDFKGERGDGWVVRGYFVTLERLEASVQNPEQGDTYAVGQREPYVYYSYDTELGFVSQGSFSPAAARSYATGGTGTRAGEDTDNAKYYSEKAKEYAENLALAPKGTAKGRGSVRIYDVSPIAHNMKITVTTPQNIRLLPYEIDNVCEIDGVHANVLEDGNIVIDGVCNTENEGVCFTPIKRISLGAGKYYLNIANAVNNVAFCVGSQQNGFDLAELAEGSTRVDFELYERTDVYLSLKTQFVKGESYSVTLKPYLYSGVFCGYDLFSLKSVDVIDGEGRVTAYPCQYKAEDNAIVLTARSTPRKTEIRTGQSNYEVKVEYNRDTAAFNNIFCNAIEANAKGSNIARLYNVSKNNGKVSLQVLPKILEEDMKALRIHGANLLNLSECTVNDGTITSVSNATGPIIKPVIGTYGPEIVINNGLFFDTLSNLKTDEKFTLSVSSVPEDSVIAVKILYDDDSEEEFYSEAGARFVTFEITLTEGRRVVEIYLYPRKTNTPVASSKTVTKIQLEAGDKHTPFELYSMKEYVLKGDIDEIPSEYPSMTLITHPRIDVIDAEYTQDINGVLEELRNSIAALG